MGMGCPLPSRLGGLVERRNLPQRGLGQSQLENGMVYFYF